MVSAPCLQLADLSNDNSIGKGNETRHASIQAVQQCAITQQIKPQVNKSANSTKIQKANH